MIKKIISLHVFAALICLAASNHADAQCATCGNHTAATVSSSCDGGCAAGTCDGCGGVGLKHRIDNMYGHHPTENFEHCFTCDNVWDGYCEAKRKCLPHAKYPLPNYQGGYPGQNLACGQCGGAGCGACGVSAGCGTCRGVGCGACGGGVAARLGLRGGHSGGSGVGLYSNHARSGSRKHLLRSLFVAVKAHCPCGKATCGGGCADSVGYVPQYMPVHAQTPVYAPAPMHAPASCPSCGAAAHNHAGAGGYVHGAGAGVGPAVRYAQPAPATQSSLRRDQVETVNVSKETMSAEAIEPAAVESAEEPYASSEIEDNGYDSYGEDADAGDDDAESELNLKDPAVIDDTPSAALESLDTLPSVRAPSPSEAAPLPPTPEPSINSQTSNTSSFDWLQRALKLN